MLSDSHAPHQINVSNGIITCLESEGTSLVPRHMLRILNSFCVQDQGRFEKTSSAERPSGNSGTTSLLPSSKSLLTSPPVQSLMSTEAHLDKAGPEVNQQDQFQGENKQETQNQDQGSALTGKLNADVLNFNQTESSSSVFLNEC